MRGVITAPPPEGHQEGLRDQVFRGIRSQAPRDVTADRCRMPVEQRAETLRGVQRPRDKRGIIARVRAGTGMSGWLPRGITHVGASGLDSCPPSIPR